MFSLGSRDFLSAFVCPLRPDPCEDYSWVPLFSLLSGCFLFAVVASLFFFFFSSGAGETQTAQRFVVPLVLSRPRSSSSTRSPSSTDTSRHTARTCFFLFVVSPLVVGFGLSWRWWASLSLSLSLFLFLSLCGPACAACMPVNKKKEGVAYQTAPPAMIIIV